jgi:hypothetical protein
MILKFVWKSDLLFSINNMGPYKFLFDSSLKETPLSHLETLTYIYRELDELYVKSHPHPNPPVHCNMFVFFLSSLELYRTSHYLGLVCVMEMTNPRPLSDRYLMHILLQISYIECAKFQLFLL